MLITRPGLSPVMVGRTAELSRLSGLVGASPTPSVALIGGEAGIGKTRLVRELLDAASADTMVFAGQADPGTVGRPMELLLDTLRRIDLASHPDLAEIIEDADRSSEDRVRAGVSLVQRLLDGHPGLVVFEDLHWADSESLAVFERLAEPESGSILLVGTYRPDGLTRRQPAAELLPRLERRHSVTHVHLARLHPAEVASFLAAVYGTEPSFRVVDELHRRTGGNPFFLEELVASAGDRPMEELVGAPLPWSISELVRAQLDSLEPEVRSIITTASVLGRRVTFDVLAAVAGTPEAELIDRLRAAVRSGLLVETAPDVFSFHHDLAKEAIKTGLLGRERRLLHEAALEVLLEAPERDHIAIARHAEGAGRTDLMVGEARAGAAQSLARGSTYQALQLAETGITGAEDDLELRALATRAAWLAGLLDEAVEHSDLWLRFARADGDISQEAAALGQRMRVAYDLGDLAGMEAFTEALIATIDQLSGDEERARAMASVAQSYMLRDLVGPTCDWADKALELAIANGFEDVRLAAMIEKGTALMLEPATDVEGEDLLREAAAEAERAQESLLAARALMNLVWMARQRNEVEEARALLNRMRKHAEAAGSDDLTGQSSIEAMSLIAMVDGDLETAISVLDDDDVSAGHGWALSRHRRWLAVLRAGLALEAGDLDLAAKYTEEAKPPSARSLVGVLGLDVHLAARHGDLPRFRAAMVDYQAALIEEGVAFAPQVHDIVTSALGAGIEPEELRPLVEETGRLPGHRYGSEHPWRQLLEGQLAEAAGEIPAAAGHYAAAAQPDESSMALLARHLGTAHVGAARCLIALGQLGEARTHVDAAAEQLARWQGWRVDELIAVQRRLGIGPEPTGPDALTPREREVAALVAEGLTNAGLAERLFISPRTAAVHVSNILAKLGMSSRTEVATWAVRAGLTAGAE